MEKIICTSNYENVKNGNRISISGDRGKGVNYEGKPLPILAPKKYFWQIWHNNIGKISEEENTLFYVENYYNSVLSTIDPDTLLNMLSDRSVLLCYEDSTEFCHRHLVAYYLELFLGIETYEVKEKENYKLEIMPRPEYLKDILERVIKENYNMHGFNSIKAAYLYQGANNLEEDIKEKYKDEYFDDYAGEMMTMACRLRMDADEEEQKYLLKNKEKIKKYTD